MSYVAASNLSQTCSAPIWANSTTFRVYVLEDATVSQKLALKRIQSAFEHGGFGNALELVTDISQNYGQLLSADLQKIQDGFYRVVLVDNNLSHFPDAVNFGTSLCTGAKLIFECVKKTKVKPSTLFILNSSNNVSLAHDFPELREVFQLIPSDGKNSKEAFAMITDLFQSAHKEALALRFPNGDVKQGISVTIQPTPSRSPSPSPPLTILDDMMLTELFKLAHERTMALHFPNGDAKQGISITVQRSPSPSPPLTIVDDISSPRDIPSPYPPIVT